jgi:hypothetical protein
MEDKRGEKNMGRGEYFSLGGEQEEGETGA